MEKPPERIIRFLKKHHIFTLATSCNNQPWCCTCFYVYDETENRLIFTSDKETRHIQEALLQPEVSGAVALETRIVGKIRGVQFSGILSELTQEEYHVALNLYLKRFPYAAPFIKDTALWSLRILFMKMTDNRLGFGKKIIWLSPEKTR